MTRAISETEFATSASILLRGLGSDTVVIQRGESVLGALVSPEEYEFIQAAKAERAIAALETFGRHIQTVATADQIDKLEATLAPNAS